MIHVPNTGFEPGTIIVAAAIQPRYYEFTMSTEGLHVPAGTKLIIQRSCDVTQNFNKGMQALTGSWAWFVGDDHAFAPDTLLKLLAHRVNVVVPISPCKVPPWMPCVMHGPIDPDVVWHENMLLYDWDELSGRGLLALPKGDFIGQSGMLVQKATMDKIGYPWFKCGQLDPGRLQEDMYFCKELQDLGETVYVDQDMIFDHYFIVGVTTRRHEGKHVPALKFGESVVVLPEAKPAFDPNTVVTGDERTALKWKPLPRGPVAPVIDLAFHE